MIVFIGMETSGKLRRRFQKLGIETYSCDLLPSDDGGEEMVYSDDSLPLGRHLIGDVFQTLDNLKANDLWPEVAIFHPECTYLTNSAAWAYKDPDFERYPGVGYHQRIKPGTLVGADRRAARDAAIKDWKRIDALPIKRKIAENPAAGALSRHFRKPDQVIQPNWFGDDASKATGLWLWNVKQLTINPDLYVPPRWVCNGSKRLPRWSNQTDTGQNRLSPGEHRWKERSRTYDGIADAIVKAVMEALS